MRNDYTGYKPEGSKLTAIEYAGHGYWKCKCDCGNIVEVETSKFVTLSTRSCGCLRKERVVSKETKKRLSEVNTKHGCIPKQLHSSWIAMKSRCNNPNNNRYHIYGGRGIKVCEEWNNSFIAFRDWALANGWKEGLTIDRIDSNGNYEPSNCKWSTQREQQNNRRDTLKYSYQGETKSLHDWCREYQLPYSMVYQRIRKLNQSFEQAMRFETE